MHYSLEKVSTVAACDALLVLAQKRKLNLERKRRNLGESIDTFSERVDQIGQDSVWVRTMLEMFTATYKALPDGSRDKVSLNVEVKRLELRQARLEKKAFTCNVRALLAKQVKYNMLDGQIRAIDNYITAVQSRKMALVNPLLRVNSQSGTVLRAPVVRQKSQSQKRSYNFQGHFSGSWIVHQKKEVSKTVYRYQQHLTIVEHLPCRQGIDWRRHHTRHTQLPAYQKA